MSDTSSVNGLDLVACGLSVAREKIIEHRPVSDLAVLMLGRGTAMDVLRSEFDAQGHDVVLEAAGVIRHVQLKATVEGGKRRHVDINVRLRAKQSGCVVWMTYDPVTLGITTYRWFGDDPGLPLPDLGTRITRHTKGDMTGAKGLRPALRNLPKSRFELLPNLDGLAKRLFGPPRSIATGLVLAQLRERFGAGWRVAIADSRSLSGFHSAIQFAHLIDGYKVLEQLCELDFATWIDRMSEGARSGRFSDDPGILWTQLFLEHRRWRFASPFEPGADELAWLDELTSRLDAALARELGWEAA